MESEKMNVELSRAIALAWGVAEHPHRGPKRELSIERIVEAAMAIADAEGLEAVSMARVAKDLGYTTMSLYRYVTAKDDLLVLMQEGGLGPAPQIALPDREWREGLRSWMREALGRYSSHPWMLDVPFMRAMPTPNSVSWLEWGLAELAETGLSAERKASTVLMIDGYARWWAMMRRNLMLAATEHSGAESGAEEYGLVLQMMAESTRFPQVVESISAGLFGSTEGSVDDPFVEGFEQILDGIDVHIRRAAAGEDPAPMTFPLEATKADLKARRKRQAQLLAWAEKQGRLDS